MILKKYLFYVYVYMCVTKGMYVNHICAGVHRGIRSLELKSQAVVSLHITVPGRNPGSPEKAALNHLSHLSSLVLTQFDQNTTLE